MKENNKHSLFAIMWKKTFLKEIEYTQWNNKKNVISSMNDFKQKE